MNKLAKYKKAVAAVVAGAVVWVAMIPTDADPRLVAAGQLVTALAVLLGPANAPTPSRHGPAMTRLADPGERPRRPPFETP